MREQHSQKGAVLIVCLILVVVATSAGITVMRGSLTETAVTTAQEIEQTAIIVAESAVIDAFSEVKIGELTHGAETTLDIKTVDDRIDVSVTARQDGLVPSINSSLRLFGVASYSIRSVANDDAIGVRRTVVSGVAQRIPLGKTQ